MPNTETDALHLVETFSVPKGRFFLPPTVRNDVGYSLQIFSPTGQYKGAVTAQGMQQRAKEGDQVLRINMGPQSLAVSGSLKTKDGFTRAYTLTLVIKIDNPEPFAVLYRTNSDPVEKLRQAVDGQLQRWAESLKHDEIVESALRFWANQGATLIAARLGFRVERVERANVDPDPHYARLRDIARDEEIRQAEHINQVRINEENRGEDARNQAASRTQREQNEQLDMRLSSQKQITQAMVNAFTRKMEQGMRDGIPLGDIIAQDPDLAVWVSQITAPSAEAQLGPGATTSPITQQMIDAARASARSGGFAQSVPDAGEREIPSLGMTLAPVPLTDEQLHNAEQARLMVDRAYVIRRMDDQGPAAQSNLAVNDVVIQIAEQSLQDLDTVTRIFETSDPGVPLKIYFFRGREIYGAEPLPQPVP